MRVHQGTQLYWSLLNPHVKRSSETRLKTCYASILLVKCDTVPHSQLKRIEKTPTYGGYPELKWIKNTGCCMCQTRVSVFVDRCLVCFHVDDRRARSTNTVHQTDRDMEEQQRWHFVPSSMKWDQYQQIFFHNVKPCCLASRLKARLLRLHQQG